MQKFGMIILEKAPLAFIRFLKESKTSISILKKKTLKYWRSYKL